MKTIYLAGPMKGITWEKAGDWRLAFADMMPDHIATLSPLRGKAVETPDNIIQNSYEENPITSVNGINMRDYNDVKSSDMILANLKGAEWPSVGTIMEIAWARAYKQPCVIIVDEDCVRNPNKPKQKTNKWQDHPMLLDWGCVVVSSLEAAAYVCIGILSNDRQIGTLPAEERNPDGVTQEGML